MRLGILCLNRLCRNIGAWRRIQPPQQMVLLLLSATVGVGCTVAVLLFELPNEFELAGNGTVVLPTPSVSTPSLTTAAGWGLIWPVSVWIFGYEMRLEGCWQPDRLDGRWPSPTPAGLPYLVWLPGLLWLGLAATLRGWICLVAFAAYPQDLALGIPSIVGPIVEVVVLVGSLLLFALAVWVGWQAFPQPTLLDEPLNVGRVGGAGLSERDGMGGRGGGSGMLDEPLNVGGRVGAAGQATACEASVPVVVQEEAVTVTRREVET